MKNFKQYDDIKRKLRKLKKLEIRIRFAGDISAAKLIKADLLWDEFFDLHDTGTGTRSGSGSKKESAKYPMNALFMMNKDEYREVVDEYFFNVYFRFYKDNGLSNLYFYEPDILTQLGLPFDADMTAIKKKFRGLALKYHPDTGGDADKFMELMENYKKLI
ncbi:MAG: DnaJ domain-containing protein [Saccharofermentanales bacterium]